MLKKEKDFVKKMTQFFSLLKQLKTSASLPPIRMVTTR